jgi:hypothetical protein
MMAQRFLAPGSFPLIDAVRRLLRPTRSGEPAAFEVFIRRQGAFVAQKTVLDYCRVKLGRSEKAYFENQDFLAALRHCRWQVYLGAMADVTALAEAWLRPHVADQMNLLAERLSLLHAAILSSENPPSEEAPSLTAAIAALPGHLAGLQLAAPFGALKLPLQAEAPLLATLPIHPEQRIGEAPAIRGALRFHIVSTQQEMERNFDAEPLAHNLIALVGHSE